MSSGFVTEAELEEKRRVRQEEWEKVRQADQPEEVPDEPYDHRSLFDRLEEQKQKKQMEFEEAHKLSKLRTLMNLEYLENMIKGLDDDEVEFLDFVDQKKIEAEQRKELEEKKELADFRMRVEKLKENSIDERIQAEMRRPVVTTTSISSAAKSQQKLLQGAVIKRKNVASDSDGADSKKSRESICEAASQVAQQSPLLESAAKRKLEKTPFAPSAVTCVGILPGLAHYSPSSDSDSSDSQDEQPPEHLRTKYDLLGRKLVYESKEKPH